MLADFAFDVAIAQEDAVGIPAASRLHDDTDVTLAQTPLARADRGMLCKLEIDRHRSRGTSVAGFCWVPGRFQPFGSGLPQARAAERSERKRDQPWRQNDTNLLDSCSS